MYVQCFMKKIKCELTALGLIYASENEPPKLYNLHFFALKTPLKITFKNPKSVCVFFNTREVL